MNYMSMPIINTKLYMPRDKGTLVVRPGLVQHLNSGIENKLTLVSASAGFGKTTLLTQWLKDVDRSIAWISLDSSDSNIFRFLSYVVSSLQKITPSIDDSLLDIVQYTQLQAIEYILTSLVNTIDTNNYKCILVLDDYHLIDNLEVDSAVDFIIQHMPNNLHLVIASREDPNIHLANLRATRQMTELRNNDLKFSTTDIESFFSEVINMNLSKKSIMALEDRTEGWIAGLQLVGVSFKNQDNIEDKIKALTGNHKFILDYLINEVLNHQTDQTREFLMHTSILRQMNVELCKYVLGNEQIKSDIFTTLEQSNLFVVSLDENRDWYRYHHLFADLLYQHLLLHYNKDVTKINELHIRASKWYEQAGNGEEAFYHTTCANNIERALYLLNKSKNQSLNQGMNTTIINWIDSFKDSVVKDYPELYIWQASLMLIMGRTTGVEELLIFAEKHIDDINLHGRISTARATLALTRYDIPTIIREANNALDKLDNEEIYYRSSALWKLGFAYQISKEYDKAKGSYKEALRLAKTIKDDFRIALATVGLGNVYEIENKWELAHKAYTDVLEIAGAKPLQYASEAHMGLSRIYIAQGEHEQAESHARNAINLAKQYDNAIDRFVLCEVQLASVKLVKDEIDEAIKILLEAEKTAIANEYSYCLPVVAEILVKAHMQNNDVDNASKIAYKYGFEPVNQSILVDRLTPREFEILDLIGKGMSNREIGEKLFLALDTVKGHNRRIFEKLQVSRRTEAVARAKDLNIL